MSAINGMRKQIESLRGSDDESAAFLIDDLADLFQRTVEGYLIAVQSMWERGLRGALAEREKKLCGGAALARIERATWGGSAGTLQQHFRRLMGIPIEAFDTYKDLDLLQNLGSAIRHGDGNAARRVHQLCPSLWFNWLAPGQEIVAGELRIKVPLSAPPHPSFESISLPEATLEQMIQSVLWFWADMENIRCNSFRRKHHTVLQRLAAWGAERAQRTDRRVWNAC